MIVMLALLLHFIQQLGVRLFQHMDHHTPLIHYPGPATRKMDAMVSCLPKFGLPKALRLASRTKTYRIHPILAFPLTQTRGSERNRWKCLGIIIFGSIQKETIFSKKFN